MPLQVLQFRIERNVPSGLQLVMVKMRPRTKRTFLPANLCSRTPLCPSWWAPALVRIGTRHLRSPGASADLEYLTGEGCCVHRTESVTLTMQRRLRVQGFREGCSAGPSFAVRAAVLDGFRRKMLRNGYRTCQVRDGAPLQDTVVGTGADRNPFPSAFSTKAALPIIQSRCQGC